jgi:hypothetical protein
MFFVSEADILLATRRALFDEIVTYKSTIVGADFDALFNFIKLLRKVRH